MAPLVLAALKMIPGVQGVDPADGEGEGTLGYKLRYGNEDPRRSLFEAAVKNDWVLLEVQRAHVSLEETFRKLTTIEKRAA